MGDFTLLNEKRNFILGVSATPFSEIVANKKVRTGDWTAEEKSFIDGIKLEAKNFYFMKPGQGYIGVNKLMASNAIKFESAEIKPDSCCHIADVLRNGSDRYDNKFSVLRTHRAEKDQDTVQTIATSLGYDYKAVFGGDTDLKFMEEQPRKKTIVHICGRFRMGQVVPKKFIAMVYEQSKSPNADTILQGLLGRMCGYEDEGAHTSVDIFVSAKAEELVQKYDKAWSTGEMDVLATVNKAMNLGGGKRKNGGAIVTIGQGSDKKKYIATVPVEFHMRDLDEGGVKFLGITPQHLSTLFRNKAELIAGNPDKAVTLETLEKLGCPGNKLHYHKAYQMEKPEHKIKSDKFYSVLQKAVGANDRKNITSVATTAAQKKMTWGKFECSSLSIYGSDENDDNPAGKCYLMGYVPYITGTHPAESDEIVAVDPKCNHSVCGIVNMEDDSVLDNVNGGQTITFSLETRDNPDLLKEELGASIRRTMPGHETYIPSAGRSIHSLYDKAKCGY
jgi:hypothetical protein